MRIPGLEEHNRRSIEQFIRKLGADGRPATALGEAARWGRKDLLEELLASGIEVDARTETGATALMLAASGGQTEIARFLIDHGADVNAVDETHGNSALIWCLSALHARRVYVAICKALLKAGASIHVRAKDGRTALDWAKDGRPDAVVALLSKSSADGA